MSKLLYHHKWMDLCANRDDEAFIPMQDAVLMIPLAEDNEFVLIEEQPANVRWMVDIGKTKDSTAVAALFMAQQYLKIGLA